MTCLFLLFVVTLDVSVTEYKGGAVTLPCTHTGPTVNATLSNQEMTFMWRFKDSKIVHDFVNGKHDLSEQENQFKGRTSLSDAQKGNFSLQLTNLTENDSGQYKCFLPLPQTSQKVTLTIKGMLFSFSKIP